MQLPHLQLVSESHVGAQTVEILEALDVFREGLVDLLVLVEGGLVVAAAAVAAGHHETPLYLRADGWKVEVKGVKQYFTL